MDEDLISIPAAAVEIGINRSTLRRQIAAGSIRSYGRKVRLSEVLEDRANNIDASIWAHRRAKASGAASALHATGHAPSGALHATVMDEDDDDGAMVEVDGEVMAIGKAKALKETYLARLRKLEYERKTSRFVDAATSRQKIVELSQQDHDAWSVWPGKISGSIAIEFGLDPSRVRAVIQKYVDLQLADRRPVELENINFAQSSDTEAPLDRSAF